MRGKENSNIIITIVVAAVTVISISLYECWWMRNLFNTTYESMELGISSSMALAELSSDKTVSLYLKYDVDSVRDTTPKILSLSAVSQIPAKQIAGITINKKEDNTLDAVLYDSLLTARLKYSGLDIPHAVRIIKDSISVSESGFADLLSVRETQIFTHKSTLHQEVDYQFIGTRLTEYVLKRMTGIICVSVSLLIILILAFAIIIKTLHKQSALDRIKTDFARNMTHELKTPIASISLAAQMMNDASVTKSPQMMQHLGGVIQDESKRLRFLVEKVLQMSMFDRKKAVFKKKRLDLNEMVENISRSFTLRVEHTGGKIYTDIEAVDSTIYVDEVHFQNVIFNLLDNAVKYGKPGEKLDVYLKTWNDENWLYLSVRDTGVGIKKDDLKKVFEKFYRVHTGNVHDVKGFGLGLAYVKKMVELHGGSIKVDSEYGKGTIFTIKLPVIKDE